MHQIRIMAYALLALALSAVALSAAPVATAAPIRISVIPGSNGVVHAISEPDSQGTRYLGGGFTAFDSWGTGGGGLVDNQTGLVNASFPKVTGTVWASAADGSGGFYIGGLFTAVNGTTRNNLAHINSDGSLDTWNPIANGAVYSLAVSGTTVYLGGAFTTIFQSPRNNVAAVNSTTGAVLSWNPDANSTVRSIAVSESNVYLGGNFTTIGGTTRNKIAAVNNTDGTLTNWNPSATGPFAEFTVIRSIAVSGSTIYLGGAFTAIGGAARNYVAAVNNTDGAATSWNPDANNSVRSIAVSESAVYLGGDFITIGDTTRNNIAAINTDGTLTNWNPNANSTVWSTAVSGSTIYIGGEFTIIGDTTRNNIAAINNTTGAVTSMQLPPAIPAAPIATVQDGKISVSVSPGTAIGGTPGSYTVQTVQDATKTCVVTATTGSCTVTPLTIGTSYTFIAVAQNSGGTSNVSAVSNPVTLPTTVSKAVIPTVKKGKSISLAKINKYAKVKIPKGATVVLTVAKASKKKCAVSKTRVRGIAVGLCKLSIAVTPRATTKVKKPKTVKTQTKVIVIK